MSPSKRNMVSPSETLVVHGSRLLRPLVAHKSESSSSTATLPANFVQRNEAKNASTVSLSLPQPKNTPQSAPGFPSHARAGFLTTLVHGFWSRVRRASRCSLWEALVFCSFASAAVMFLRALVGAGYVPDHNLARTSRQIKAPPSTTYARFLQFPNTEWVPTDKHAERSLLEAKGEEEERVSVKSVLEQVWSPTGRWITSDHRMSGVRRTDDDTPPAAQINRANRQSESSQFSPSRSDHRLFHERYFQRILSSKLSEFSGFAMDLGEDEGSEGHCRIMDGDNVGGQNCGEPGIFGF